MTVMMASHELDQKDKDAKIMDSGVEQLQPVKVYFLTVCTAFPIN